jgi:hypothetical protein
MISLIQLSFFIVFATKQFFLLLWLNKVSNMAASDKPFNELDV